MRILGYVNFLFLYVSRNKVVIKTHMELRSCHLRGKKTPNVFNSVQPNLCIEAAWVFIRSLLLSPHMRIFKLKGQSPASCQTPCVHSLTLYDSSFYSQPARDRALTATCPRQFLCFSSQLNVTRLQHFK